MSCDFVIPKFSLIEDEREQQKHFGEIAALYYDNITDPDDIFKNEEHRQKEIDAGVAKIIRDEENPRRFLTACVDYYEELIGAVSYGFYKDYEPEVGRIFRIAVKPEHQRGGVGYELLSRAEFMLEDMGARAIELASTPLAVEFYRKMGYSAIGRYSLYFRKNINKLK
jgi:GNAT superfamily N-acetyltransferase